MALLDALLLDPYPFQIWIAKRTDGIKGSGTASDPYDGSTAAKLDFVLNNHCPANSHVHLGAGVKVKGSVPHIRTFFVNGPSTLTLAIPIL